MPVTAGFQLVICNTCRGLPEEAHPKAQMRGCSTKIRRYYWREIFMETTRRLDEWATARGLEKGRERYRVAATAPKLQEVSARDFGGSLLPGSVAYVSNAL